ncbi:MAG: hypothetical protein LBB60_03285, partial [Desulfovibrio sp.]|nr:hypothetical protein [Desulfovibrio sp.]
MPTCKKCGSGQIVKSGVVAGKQRFLCKECGCNFREGDARTSEKVAAKKALGVLLYAMAKGSFRMMGWGAVTWPGAVYPSEQRVSCECVVCV